MLRSPYLPQQFLYFNTINIFNVLYFYVPTEKVSRQSITSGWVERYETGLRLPNQYLEIFHLKQFKQNCQMELLYNIL
jgi:hypothetical protein